MAPESEPHPKARVLWDQARCRATEGRSAVRITPIAEAVGVHPDTAREIVSHWENQGKVRTLGTRNLFTFTDG